MPQYDDIQNVARTIFKIKGMAMKFDGGTSSCRIKCCMKSLELFYAAGAARPIGGPRTLAFLSSSSATFRQYEGRCRLHAVMARSWEGSKKFKR